VQVGGDDLPFQKGPRGSKGDRRIRNPHGRVTPVEVVVSLCRPVIVKRIDPVARPVQESSPPSCCSKTSHFLAGSPVPLPDAAVLRQDQGFPEAAETVNSGTAELCKGCKCAAIRREILIKGTKPVLSGQLTNGAERFDKP
jgi:hypothetical protein